MDDIILPDNDRPRHPKEHKKPIEIMDESSEPKVDHEAAQSVHHTSELALQPHPEPDSKPPKTKKVRWWQLKHQNLSKKQKILIIATVAVLIIGGGVAAYYTYQHFGRDSLVASAPIKKVKPKPVSTTVPSDLTGLPVDPSVNKQQVTAIMIENSDDARPQSGLLDAGIVYEAIAEGGITRFMALYQGENPTYIGPVRSVRPYYLDFLMPFDAAVAHVGGSPNALSDITTFHIKNLDEFFNGGSYTRITSRVAPHNVYTSMANLNALEASKGYTTSSYVSFPRKSDSPSKQPTATSIDFAISSADFNVHYDYDSAANSYKRSEGGAPHTDQPTGKQLEPKVVMALVMNRGIDSDGQHTDYTDTGSGPLYLFQDGTAVQGTWHKASRQGQFSFTDTSGKPLKLNAGQTWISIVDAGTVSYK